MIDLIIENNPFIISDTHLNHRNIIKYTGRPFYCIKEMDRTIIDNWNSVVSPQDFVLHLGDFSLSSKAQTVEYINALNGHIILILGNHDRRTVTWWERMGVFFATNSPIMYENIVFSHRPVDIQDGCINIHGHIHEHKAKDNKHINVSVERLGYTPIKLFTLLDRYTTMKEVAQCCL